MKYSITGTPLPVVECVLEPGESIFCEGGAMSWMSGNMNMETKGGGLGKIFSKAFSGERLFHNTYTAVGGEGTIAFASSFPGDILAIELSPGQELICQKSAFLAATPGIDVSIYFQKKIGAGFFGGEGFIMQRMTGTGLVFVEIDGSVVEKVLAPGQQIVIDSGYLAMMEGTCSMDVQMVKGVKNAVMGGEGLFNTIVTGPGRVTLQTMPAGKLASLISSFIPSKG